MTQTTPPLKVMGVFAHPDDAVFFAGGTIAKFAQDGAEVTIVVATSGDKGSSDPTMTPDRLISIREAEERACNQILGVKEVIFLRYTDGELYPTLELRRDVTRLIRLKQPDIVIALDPTSYWFGSFGINHPDHRAIGAATIEAIYPTARDRLNFVEQEQLEGLSTHKVLTVYVAGSTQPDTKVDISDTLETKLLALKEHVSQISNPEETFERVRERGLDPNAPKEYPRYVENFKVIQLR
jgi:LmbE family N-acetylglucosaminyl deacetylase